MGKFCSNCGKELNENAVICVNCGVYVDNVKIKNKTPGKGLSIASMVLGIIAIFYGVCFLVMSSAFASLDEIYFYYYYNKFALAFAFNIWPLAISITGLSLGVASIHKVKNSMNLAGIILSSITILLCIISFLILIISL